jgi:beta-mannosidase
MTNLHGNWSLADADGDHACILTLPGDGVTALHAAGLIPDPYWGRNEYDLRWISERDWVARRTVELDDTAVDLVLDRVDTVATVRVNGQVVLNPRNAFRGYRVSLAGVAQVGANEIEIVFHSPVVEGKRLYEAHPFPIPWSKNCPIPYGNFLRKPACDFGWDWNIALAPFGVYGDMRIEPAGVPRIDSVLVHQDHADGVTLTVTVDVKKHDDVVTAAFAGVTATAQPVDGRCVFEIAADDLSLWWPAGHGDQLLHGLTVTAGAATKTLQIGLRQIELVTEADDGGLGFKVRVNGKDIWCKGANWIPADALPGRITDDKTRALLQSARDANMNMIRVWGGGRYEPDSFFAACDELGLLVWQDFMFACNLYPSDPAYLAEVSAEVSENVRRIQHHASLALWCGDNELVGALTWYDVSRADRDRYLVNYDRLNRTIEQTLREVDPQAIWWPSSPSAGPLNFGDAWHDDGSGDMHFWSVWHENREFAHYRDVTPRFCSEFGFQSYPSRSVIDTFCPTNRQNIADPIFESHQKNEGGNERIAGTMFRYFRWSERFDDFVYVSQVQHGLAMRTAVTHWRAHAPHSMGALYWQLNDTWPVCSWASLDYGGGWKLLHHMARDFFAPVMVTAVPQDDGSVTLMAHDDRGDGSLTVTARAVAMDGRLTMLCEKTVTVGVDATAVADVTIPDGAMLVIDWTGAGEGREVHAPRPYKTYDLPEAALKLEATQDGDAWQLVVSAQALALFVAIEADQPGQFSANAFDMLPGETRTITFTPSDPAATPTFTLRDLASATQS